MLASPHHASSAAIRSPPLPYLILRGAWPVKRGYVRRIFFIDLKSAYAAEGVSSSARESLDGAVELRVPPAA